MKSSVGVKIDYSFVELVFEYSSNPSGELINQIISHTVARKIISNAQISNPNIKDTREFWKKILDKERNRKEDYFIKTKSCIDYLKENTEVLMKYVEELYNYLPDDFVFDCTLYLHVGYDIGIVAEGDALLNVGHEIFHKNNRELIYFALHELHHVGFTHYHDLDIKLPTIQTRDEFVRVIEKLTHLEGTATYAVKAIRERDSQLSFFDYEVLSNKEKLTESINKYFNLYDKYKYSKNLMIEEQDFETFEIMSGRNKRLWYVVGAYMSEKIDKTLGRKVLNNTILDGPSSFFDKYSECKENSP